MHKALESTYIKTPKFIDEIKDDKVLDEQEQRKQAIKERVQKYMRISVNPSWHKSAKS